MDVETRGRARSFQIVAIHARKRVGVRPVRLAPEQRSSATDAGSCEPSTNHVRTQQVASPTLPRLKTSQKGNSPCARLECRSQKSPAFHAIRAGTKGTQEQEQQG